MIVNKPGAVLSRDAALQETADHALTGITVDINKLKKSPMIRTLRQLAKYTSDFCLKLFKHKEHFNTTLSIDDVNRQVEIFTSYFIKCLDACAPSVTKEIKRPCAPRMTDELQMPIKLKNETRK